MPSNYWIKLYHEILDDPKMGTLPDRLYRRVMELFLLAGENRQDGGLPSIEDMAWRLRLSVEELEEDLQDLELVEIVEHSKDGWFISNFAKRQAPVPGAERVARFREQKRKEEYYGTETEQDGNGDVTNCYTDTDIDKDLKAAEAANGKPPPEKKPKRKRSEREQNREVVIEYFLERTGLPPPKYKTEKEKKSASVLWWQPTDEIVELAEGDVTIAKNFVDVSITRLNGKTVSDMNSILKTARSVYAEKKKGKSEKFVELS